MTTFYKSDSSDVVVFEQSFPATVATGAQDDASDTEVVSCFPSISSLDTDFNYLTYYGTLPRGLHRVNTDVLIERWQIIDTFAVPHIGHWKSPAFPGGNTGGVPLVIYNRALRALIISPLK